MNYIYSYIKILKSLEPLEVIKSWKRKRKKIVGPRLILQHKLIIKQASLEI